MPNQKTIREEITTKIVAALEKDLLPWRRPWSTGNAGRHTNVISKKPYSGVKPKEEWKLRSARELLDLKILDMACGSGAFLVQADRYLAERLRRGRLPTSCIPIGLE
jgi:type II restriction/modification system DNA methylase subunit YeeA